MKNMINWFEIPVTDFNRAKKFYETVMDFKIETMEMMGMTMGMFPGDEGKVSGALVKGDFHKPSSDGVVIYLNGNPDLSVYLGRVDAAGGQIVMPKTDIGSDFGQMAFIIDTEGNKVAFHSQN